MNLIDLDFIGKPQGAKNIALVRPFAINFRPAATAKRSIKRRKQAGWDPRAMPASTRNQTTDQRQITTAAPKPNKEAACVATSGPSLGRKHPMRASAATILPHRNNMHVRRTKARGFA
jgi:hypothetical protein